MLACETLARATAALRAVQEVSGGGVEAFEYMPDVYIARHMARTPGAREPFAVRWPVNILLEVAATNARDAEVGPDGGTLLQAALEEALASLLDAGTICDAVIAKSGAERQEMWARRERAAELSLAELPLFVCDIAVPVDRMAEFIARTNERMAALDPDALPFWMAHLGDGNVHYTVRTSAQGARKEALVEAVEDVVADLGGTFSAEHGVGIAKLGSMARRKDPVALEAMRAIKAALDPKRLMNPGKVVP
jgi:FAD/FMN-containing dehydrogenase